MSSDLTPSQNERLRTAMLAFRKEECGDNTTKLADRLGRSQPALSDFLNRKGGAAHKTAKAFARLIGKSVDEALGPEGPVDGEPALPQPTTHLDDRTFRTLIAVEAAYPWRPQMTSDLRAIVGKQARMFASVGGQDYSVEQWEDTFMSLERTALGFAPRGVPSRDHPKPPSEQDAEELAAHKASKPPRKKR